MQPDHKSADSGSMRYPAFLFSGKKNMVLELPDFPEAGGVCDIDKDNEEIHDLGQKLLLDTIWFRLTSGMPIPAPSDASVAPDGSHWANGCDGYKFVRVVDIVLDNVKLIREEDICSIRYAESCIHHFANRIHNPGRVVSGRHVTRNLARNEAQWSQCSGLQQSSHFSTLKSVHHEPTAIINDFIANLYSNNYRLTINPAALFSAIEAAGPHQGHGQRESSSTFLSRSRERSRD